MLLHPHKSVFEASSKRKGISEYDKEAIIFQLTLFTTVNTQNIKVEVMDRKGCSIWPTPAA